MKNIFLKNNRIILFYPYLFLFLATVCVYWQTNDFSFVGLDDALYVAGNRHVQSGLSWETVQWAFTDATEITNFWAPLTWLSILADYELYGMNAGGYHITNLILHLINCLLVMLLFQKMTGKLWQSTFVAFMFALHPLHVESVAWVTERKDVLSTLFWLLTMWAYHGYSRRPCIKRYILIFLFFILGMMAKPMLITLPFAMLLLDFWPLNRLKMTTLRPSIRNLLVLTWEKIPLFACVLLISIVAYFFQDKGGVLPSIELIPASLRAENIIVSYGLYLWKTLWPFQLAAVYPYPDSLPNRQVLISLTLLVCLTIMSIKLMKKAPWFLFGWLWYLGILVPVIGIVVIGPHSMADRYTYIPLIGIFVIIAWGVPELLRNFHLKREFLSASFFLLIMICSVITWNQIGYWRNSYTLYKHTIKHTASNPLAHDGFATALSERGDFDGAIKHYQQSIQLYPNSAEVHNNLGVALLKTGRIDDAIEQYRRSIALKPDYTAALNNLGNALKKTGRCDQAEPYYRKALENEPDSALLHFNYGRCLLQNGKIEKAISYLETATRINPEFKEVVHNSIGSAFFHNRRFEQAIQHFRQALQKNPQSSYAHFQLGVSLDILGNHPEAIKHYQETIRTSPDHTDAHYYLGRAYMEAHDSEKAKEHFSAALQLQPNYIPALNDLGTLYAIRHENYKAIAMFRKMTEVDPKQVIAYYNIACLHSKLNEKQEAVEWLQKAIENGYDNIEKIETDKDLDNIRGNPAYAELLHHLKKKQ